MDELVKSTHYGVFDSSRELSNDGSEYWRARNLQRALGYDRWENFEEAIRRAQTACRESSQNTTYQFRETTKMMEAGKGAKRQVKDYFLSRYACYLIAMNGDPSKPLIAAAQTYFAVQTRRQELADIMSEEEERLAKRNEVKESVVNLNKTASRVGVKNYAFFHDAGYRGMYGLGVGDIKRRKGIEEKEDFLDCVSRLELVANEFRMMLTEQKLSMGPAIGQPAADEVHKRIGLTVRKTVKDEIGIGPEDLPRARNIKKVEAKKKGSLPK
ncbi:MAG TPA: DNA damage-inducible protein D [Acidobacteriota bacterium]|jgi:DNA-damage-inducible protein D|nr:DNA damage-inducible protein D [Acidobacteriota bacterium]